MTRQLEIDRVGKRYGDTVALDGITFEVREGEIFGLVGSNGAGKTTAMRIVLGVLAADEGEVRWDGRPIDLGTRRRIGYMPEERGLYPRMKVAEELIYLARLHGLTPAAARASVDSWTERLAIAGRRGDDVIKLSLGNQQRVQLAAALVHDPDILVLDEPFSGLDPVAVDVMSGVLRDQAGAGVPVMFSSHQLDLVERLCDRVGIVRQGRMVAAGTVDQLRAGGPDELVVRAPGAPSGWADQLPGVTVLDRSPGLTRLSLAEGADDQPVLRAALATGPVHEFAHRRPSLTDLCTSTCAPTRSTRRPAVSRYATASSTPCSSTGPARRSWSRPASTTASDRSCGWWPSRVPSISRSVPSAATRPGSRPRSPRPP